MGAGVWSYPSDDEGPVASRHFGDVIFWGGTGQAKVMRPVVESEGARVVAIFDDTPGLVSPFADVEIGTGIEGLKDWLSTRSAEHTGFVVTIGNPHGRARLRIHDILAREGFLRLTVVHRTAWIADGAIVGAGAQVHAGAIVEAAAVIGRQCIINTKASVDHESVLQDGVEVSPGATLCGLVEVGTGAWIGAGATVLPRVRIGSDAIVGAGAVVTRDVRPGKTVTGVPARELVGGD